MKLHHVLMMILISLVMSNCSASLDLNKTPIGLINNVTYKDSAFNNPNASNGFLVKHANKTYAVTAKHILIIAKSDKMEFVDFENELAEWRMSPKNDTDSYIVTDQLLNTNRTDSLTWSYLGNNWDTFDDWLAFSIKENKSKHKPLKLRNSDLVKGEKLFAIGWTYADTVGVQRVYEYTFEATDGNYHNLIQVKGPRKLGGLSGSPVVDEKGKVVGLVSSGWEDEETKIVHLQATTTANLVKFLNSEN